MSAATMDHSRRQILTPGQPLSTKRKERDGLVLDGPKPSAITTKNLAKPSIHRAPTHATPLKYPSSSSPKPAHSNKLLAGYLAHEFLTKGTLFGEPWDPYRAESAPLPSSPSSSSSSSSSRGKPVASEKRRAEPSEKSEEEKRLEKQRRYLEVADLMREDGVHLPGIVNPTQLGRFLQRR